MMIKNMFIFYLFISFSLYSSDKGNIFIDDIKKVNDTPPLLRSLISERMFLNNHRPKYKNFEKLEIFSTDFLNSDIPLFVHYKFKNNEVFDIYFDNYRQIKEQKLDDINVIKEKFKSKLKEKFKSKYEDIFSITETDFFKSELDNLVHYYFMVLSCIPILKNCFLDLKSKKNKKEMRETAVEINKNLKNYRSVYERIFTQFSPIDVKRMEPIYVSKEKDYLFFNRYLEMLLGKGYINTKK